MNKKQPFTIWFTGLSGSGKTTLAKQIKKQIKKPIVLLDGDIVRKTLTRDLGYTKQERDENITRIAHTAHLINKNDVSVIVSTVSPTAKIRNYARSITNNFIEIYVKCSLKTCITRDTKGYYEKAKNGIITSFVGITVPYEEPTNPELVVHTDKTTITNGCNQIIKYLQKNNFI